METDLRRLIVRHRHVGPMISALLAGTNARVRILDVEERVILDRQSGTATGEIGRHPVLVERQLLGWVEGPRVAAAVAAVLSYAAAREADKRSLSQEALDRYRELTLIYDLAGRIGETPDVGAVARVGLGEVARLPGADRPFLLVRGTDGLHAPAGVDSAIGSAEAGGLLAAIADGSGEIVNDLGADPRANDAERGFAALIAAPLAVRGERLGVIGAAADGPHEFRAGDLKVLEAIAALTAPALVQARSATA